MKSFMKVNAKFFKSKEFISWGVINIAVPLPVAFLIASRFFSLHTNGLIIISIALLILFLNVYSIFKFKKYITLFVAMIILNLASTLLVGGVSFITSLYLWAGIILY